MHEKVKKNKFRNTIVQNFRLVYLQKLIRHETHLIQKEEWNKKQRILNFEL